MSYIRSKEIKGNTYYYLVEGNRGKDGKVHQKVLKYLGTEKPEGFKGGLGTTPSNLELWNKKYGPGGGAETSSAAPKKVGLNKYKIRGKIIDVTKDWPGMENYYEPYHLIIPANGFNIKDVRDVKEYADSPDFDVRLWMANGWVDLDKYDDKRDRIDIGTDRKPEWVAINPKNVDDVRINGPYAEQTKHGELIDRETLHEMHSNYENDESQYSNFLQYKDTLAYDVGEKKWYFIRTPSKLDSAIE